MNTEPSFVKTEHLEHSEAWAFCVHTPASLFEAD